MGNRIQNKTIRLEDVNRKIMLFSHEILFPVRTLF